MIVSRLERQFIIAQKIMNDARLVGVWISVILKWKRGNNTMMMQDVIRHYRKKKGMTQQEMAVCLGVSASAVNKWESGVSLS